MLKLLDLISKLFNFLFLVSSKVPFDEDIRRHRNGKYNELMIDSLLLCNSVIKLIELTENMIECLYQQNPLLSF